MTILGDDLRTCWVADALVRDRANASRSASLAACASRNRIAASSKAGSRRRIASRWRAVQTAQPATWRASAW